MLTPSRLLTPEQLSDAIVKSGLSMRPRTVHRRLIDGAYPAFQHSGAWIIDRADVPQIVEIERRISRAKRTSAGFTPDTSAAAVSVAA